MTQYRCKFLDKCVNPKDKKFLGPSCMVVDMCAIWEKPNYVWLINNKATDAGYKVVIVIAGTISS
jgi:hypothetical protein